MASNYNITLSKLMAETVKYSTRENKIAMYYEVIKTINDFAVQQLPMIPLAVSNYRQDANQKGKDGENPKISAQLLKNNAHYFITCDQIQEDNYSNLVCLKKLLNTAKHLKDKDGEYKIRDLIMQHIIQYKRDRQSLDIMQYHEERNHIIKERETIKEMEARRVA